VLAELSNLEARGDLSRAEGEGDDDDDEYR
jgi:hypothetical protein